MQRSVLLNGAESAMGESTAFSPPTVAAASAAVILVVLGYLLHGGEDGWPCVRSLDHAVGARRWSWLDGVRRRSTRVGFLSRLPADSKYLLVGGCYDTLLAKALRCADDCLWVLLGLRLVRFRWGWMEKCGQATEATPLLRRVFGPQDEFREGVRALRRDWGEGAPFVRIRGLIASVELIHQGLRARRALVDYVSAHPEVVETPIVRPLILIGLPRTGTTILHRLLALDPASRCLRNFECLEPIPPPRLETHATDARISHAWDRWRKLGERPTFWRILYGRVWRASAIHRGDPPCILLQYIGESTVEDPCEWPVISAATRTGTLPVITVLGWYGGIRGECR